MFQLDRFLDSIEIQKYIIAKFPDKAVTTGDAITTLYDKLAGIAFQTDEYVVCMIMWQVFLIIFNPPCSYQQAYDYYEQAIDYASEVALPTVYYNMGNCQVSNTMCRICGV